MNKHWKTLPLGKVLTERKEKPSDEDLATGSVRIVSKIGFKDGAIQLRESSKTKTGMILIHPGDLVVSGINAAKGAIAIYDEESVNPVAATIYYGSYIPRKDRVDVQYLWWLLRSNTFKELLARYVPGWIKTELKAKRLLPIPVPIPSLSEQRKLSQKLNLIAAKSARLLQEKNVFKKECSVLFQTVLDRKLEQYPSDATFDNALLSPPRNGWSVKCDNVEGGTAVLTLSAVTGYNYKSRKYKITSEPTVKGAHYWLSPGDFLITRSNTPELVGHAAIYDGAPYPCIYPDLIMKLRIDEAKYLKKFVLYWLRSSVVREYIRMRAKGTSPTMKKISQGIVSNIPFPRRVAKEKQQEIINELNTLEDKMNKIADLDETILKQNLALLPSILDKAFKGEL